MDPATSLTKDQAALEILGYLNFSSGTSDTRFLSNLNAVAGRLLAADPPEGNWWNQLGQLLLAQLEARRGTSAAFTHVEQAEAIVPLVLDGLLAAYREFHRELLFHQSEAELFQPFFVGRAFEAALEQGPGWDDRERIVAAALSRLNDFVGHRPVAVLRTAQKIEPYPHELVRPIPLYIRGAGVAVGRYHDLIEQSLAILASAQEIQEQAWFDLALLDELALDPRAYDFDHPVNKRPNYQFGQWDPHHIDNLGRYRRFVLQQVTLDALVERMDLPGELAPAEALFEAGAVLAGVVLMGAGISGRGPDTHDSTVTLATLLPKIAGYRDAFYSALLEGVAGPHGERLRAEAGALKQPLGGARQHLNQRLARLRAVQLQHVHLAQLFARMGYPEASSRQARVVPVASARLLCEINGRLTAAHHAIDRVQLNEAGRLLPEIEDLLQRAIECGALVDPWNILGFQGQFSLFPSLENSVRDHRVDVLVHLVSEVFGLYARLQGEAAARGQAQLAGTLSGRLGALARWWDRFATLDVEGVEHVSGREAAESAAHVAAALGAWHQAAGAAAGDIGFWRQHVESFNSPKAYALVVEALLEKRDFVASMALLVQWIGRAEQVPLVDGEYSFCDLAVAWLQALREPSPDGAEPDVSGRQDAIPDPPTADQRWQWCTRFFDYLEANAEEYWEVPRFELAHNASGRSRLPDDDPDDGDRHGLFSAAYEEVSYRDSTADGFEADMLEGGPPAGDVELNLELERLAKRLAFLSTLARLWKIAAAFSVAADDRGGHDEVLCGWFARAVANRRDLFDLLKTVHRYPLSEPTGSRESLLEFNRRRTAKEWLLSRIIAACVDTSDAARLLVAAADNLDGGGDLAAWEQAAVDVLRAMFRGDIDETRACFAALRPLLESEPVLYVPLARRGAPGPIVGAQTLQRLLMELLTGLPRLGLLAETCQVIESAQAMEQNRPQGEGAVTEFDRLFELGYRSVVESLARAAGPQPGAEEGAGPRAVSDAELIECLERLTQSMLRHWLAHSRSLRLSVLEKATDTDRWQALKEFIQHYGGDLFTARFFNLANMRAILYQGVERWLRTLQQRGDESDRFPLLDDLDAIEQASDDRRATVERLTLTIEAVAENYPEYKDYNSTTTQSDRGELLYILLDFLRLKASYNRFAWNIRPVLLAHEVLVRHGRLSAAERWRQAAADRTAKVADWHLKRLAELSREYGVRLPTVADRIGERFVRPLSIDRVRALIPTAIEQARQGRPGVSFELLEPCLEEFIAHPSGSGLDVPAWLLALEDEVDHLSNARRRLGPPADAEPAVPMLPVTWDEVVARIKPIEA